MGCQNLSPQTISYSKTPLPYDVVEMYYLDTLGVAVQHLLCVRSRQMKMLIWFFVRGVLCSRRVFWKTDRIPKVDLSWFCGDEIDQSVNYNAEKTIPSSQIKNCIVHITTSRQIYRTSVDIHRNALLQRTLPYFIQPTVTASVKYLRRFSLIKLCMGICDVIEACAIITTRIVFM